MKALCRRWQKHKRQNEEKHFTFHLFDTAQRILEGVQRGGLVIVSLLRGQVKLQLLQSFNHLLLGLGLGGLLTTASCTITHAQRQVTQCNKEYSKQNWW